MSHILLFPPGLELAKKEDKRLARSVVSVGQRSPGQIMGSGEERTIKIIPTIRNGHPEVATRTAKTAFDTSGNFRKPTQFEL